jgi:hypothetical protein
LRPASGSSGRARGGAHAGALLDQAQRVGQLGERHDGAGRVALGKRAAFVVIVDHQHGVELEPLDQVQRLRGVRERHDVRRIEAGLRDGAAQRLGQNAAGLVARERAREQISERMALDEARDRRPRQRGDQEGRNAERFELVERGADVLVELRMLHGLELERFQPGGVFRRDGALLHEAQQPPISLAAGCFAVRARSEQIHGSAVEFLRPKLRQATDRLDQDRFDGFHDQALAS